MLTDYKHMATEIIDVEFQPKKISCIGCKNSFIFSTEEQIFFHGLGLTNVPKRCSHCRLYMRLRREGKSTETLTQFNCYSCGEKASVPFLPKNERKIFCVACYKEFKKDTLTTLAEA